jgi:hypothetical protein
VDTTVRGFWSRVRILLALKKPKGFFCNCLEAYVLLFKPTAVYKFVNDMQFFSEQTRFLQPIHHQKIHWRSVDGVPNRYLNQQTCDQLSSKTHKVDIPLIKMEFGNKVICRICVIERVFCRQIQV